MEPHDQQVVRYHLTDKLNRILCPIEDEIHPMRMETGFITCRCGQRIYVIAEMDERQFAFDREKYYQELLDRAVMLVGGADEFFETHCGRKYLDSVQAAYIRQMQRLLEKLKRRIDGE